MLLQSPSRRFFLSVSCCVTKLLQKKFHSLHRSICLQDLVVLDLVGAMTAAEDDKSRILAVVVMRQRAPLEASLLCMV